MDTMEVRRWALQAVSGRFSQRVQCEIEVRSRTRMAVPRTTFQLLVTLDGPGQIDAALLRQLDGCIARELASAWPRAEFEVYLRSRRDAVRSSATGATSAWLDTIPSSLDGAPPTP